MPCKECIEQIIRVSYSMYDPTVAKLKDKPLCDRGYQLYKNYYVCDKIKGKYHRTNNINYNIGE